MSKKQTIKILVVICILFAIGIFSTNIPTEINNVFTQKAEGNEQEKQLFSNIETLFDSNDIAVSATVNTSSGPFTYINLDLFDNKTITKIGIPVKSVSAIDENQTFTLYVVDKSKLYSNKATTALETYVLKLPLEELGESTTVNKWIYIDLESYNITLDETKTLAFSSTSDTVKWGYVNASMTNLYISSEYKFKMKVLSSPTNVTTNQNILFDIYARSNNELEDSLNNGETQQLYKDINKTFDNNDIASSVAVNLTAGPFTYLDLDQFDNKTITKIGIPVKSVTTLDENQTFTLYVVDKTKLKNNQPTTVLETYVLKLPLEELGESTTVNKWIYIDLESYNIALDETKTLAFSSTSDTVKWGYVNASLTNLYVSSNYKFKLNILSEPRDISTNQNIFFDIYAKKTILGESNTDEELAKLNEILKDKKFSILGDSISTFKGYSNDATNTNSTIGNNAVYYKGSNIITNVNDTWWKKTLDKTGMQLLVNNSYSGDTISKAHGTRSLQLHDDTGENAGTNPDIIAVYIGINDIKNGETLENFEIHYNSMISNIRNKYKDSDIFVFTHIPFYYNSTVQSLDNESLEEFNNIIRTTAKNTEKCYIVDLFANSGINSTNFKTYMGDVGLHPNETGMELISKTFVNSLETTYIKDETSKDENEDDVTPPISGEDDNKEEIVNPPVTDDEKEDEVIPPPTEDDNKNDENVTPPISNDDDKTEDEITPPTLEDNNENKEEIEIEEENNPFTSTNIKILTIVSLLLVLSVIYLIHHKKIQVKRYTS